MKNIQGRITVEALLDSRVISLVISSKFTRKQWFELKKIKKPIYMRNVDSIFNKKGLIEHIVEVNIFYKEHRKRMEINVIGEQKWNVISGISWLAYNNLEINWKMGEVKMTRCSKKCGKQWRPKQEKPK